MKIKKNWRWADLPQILTSAEVARLFGVSERAIQIRCSKGELPATKFNNKWYVDTEILKGVFER